ncbi:hypothetical protein GLOTRDRAFT_126041 [Gloeophyllum trabeum ATCC 11539]|uniref:Uncharacterized protein n=1 Tax=Gloeophyllum trabeum (strain ATCC 11539 / FP-39264 / Madison 617) TaxID=670483 RepID=S7QJA1_GLOTA|nr:uncharacterized protein GLOTRDRAFT_126041 [Gloeophyllum trabeum ATCC 11539]EPQ59746.1 hypothetical protein GLOTRDRAFT_126041 [Gloeophyllum trabeum ATCC 11539]
MSSFFQSLVAICEAPLTWKKTTPLHIKMAMWKTMKNAFPKLSLCENNWKIEEIAKQGMDLAALQKLEEIDNNNDSSSVAAESSSNNAHQSGWQEASPKSLSEKRKADVDPEVTKQPEKKKKRLNMHNPLAGLTIDLTRARSPSMLPMWATMRPNRPPRNRALQVVLVQKTNSITVKTEDSGKVKLVAMPAKVEKGMFEKGGITDAGFWSGWTNLPEEKKANYNLRAQAIAAIVKACKGKEKSRTSQNGA